eukprot:Amastigsp_a178362_234.p3 type:complete len:126 gc:universal Amastigsp_a178362_234:411-788(+)
MRPSPSMSRRSQAHRFPRTRGVTMAASMSSPMRALKRRTLASLLLLASASALQPMRVTPHPIRRRLRTKISCRGVVASRRKARLRRSALRGGMTRPRAPSHRTLRRTLTAARTKSTTSTSRRCCA